MAAQFKSQEKSWQAVFWKMPPSVWMARTNHKFMVSSIVAHGFAYFVPLLVRIVAMKVNEDTEISPWLGFLFTLILVLALVGSVGAQFCLKARPDYYELWMLLIWCSMSSSATYGMLFIHGAVSRIRMAVFNAVLWKTWPTMLFRTHASLLYLSICLINDWMATGLSRNWQSEELNDQDQQFPATGYSLSLLLTGAYACIAVVQNHRMHSLHSALAELASEKTAFQSLLNMVCDSTVWIAPDSNYVLRCDQRFDMLMGKPMQGVALSEIVHKPEEEVARLHRAMLRDAEEGCSAPPLVKLLPTTLLTATGPAAADFFIVHNQPEHQAPIHEVHKNGILVGVRLLEQSGVPSAPPPSTSCRDVAKGPPVKGSPSTGFSDADKSGPFFSTSCQSAPAVLLGPFNDQESIFTPTPHLCAEGGDCLPETAVVWSEKCAVPMPLHDVLAGEQVLCYDNLGGRLAYVKVNKAAPAGQKEKVHSVKVTLEDGSVLNMTADHPVAVQSVGAGLSSARTCLLAGDVRANSDKLLVLKMTPTLVTSVEHITDEVPKHSDNAEAVEDSMMISKKGWITIEVEQPQRYELLVSARDKYGVAGDMIAVSSCDRDPDPSRWFLREKHTFLSIPDDNISESVRANSAPPSLFRHRASVEVAKTSNSKSSEFRHSDATSTLSSLTDSLASKDDINKSNILISRRDKSSERLTDLLYWKRSGFSSQGSAHAKKGCAPCAFHHTWLRLPDQKPPCKLSYMCEFCHGCNRTSQYKSRYRKQRPVSKKQPLKTSL